jgi:P27 family predicted phage terminase small subunit
MAGRKPKPLAMKELHGNPGKRPLNKKEPQFTGAPICPEWLTKIAKEEWTRIVHELADLGLLRSTDQSALAAYCLSYARWRSAELIVEEEGQVVKEPITSGKDEDKVVLGYKHKRHPATIIAKDEKMAMSKLASLFGFDPSSRSRIQVPEGNEKPTHEEKDEDIFGNDISRPAVN